MAAIRDGHRDFVPLDVLHLENLRAVLAEYELPTSSSRRTELWQSEHGLAPARPLAGQCAPPSPRSSWHYVIGPLSNGNLALLVNMAKRAGLPWDVVIGADVTGVYKPQPAAYTSAAELLGLPPSAVMLVAAHNNDLRAARESGFATAFVLRATEHGPGPDHRSGGDGRLGHRRRVARRRRPGTHRLAVAGSSAQRQAATGSDEARKLRHTRPDAPCPTRGRLLLVPANRGTPKPCMPTEGSRPTHGHRHPTPDQCRHRPDAAAQQGRHGPGRSAHRRRRGCLPGRPGAVSGHRPDPRAA